MYGQGLMLCSRMAMQKSKENNFINRLMTVLFIFSILAAVKLIFVDYTMDEEYQIVMAYRNLSGDSIFGTMWEPHQTSAFMCIAIMYVFRLLTGGYAGVVITLRIVTELIRAALSYWIFRSVKRYTDKTTALLSALLYFNSVPKLIDIPEFSNMQLWFFTIMTLSLMEYYYRERTVTDEKRKILFLILSSAALALEILSYPSCIILFPVTIVFIGVSSREHRIRDILVYVSTDAACALVWLAVVLRSITPEDLIRNVRYSVGFDLTHDLSGSTEGKLSGSITYLWQTALMLALIFAASMLITKIFIKRSSADEETCRKFVPVVSMVLIAGVIQIFFWIVLRKGYEYPQIHLLTLFLSAGILIASYRKDKEKTERIGPFLYGFWGSVISVLAVFYISDLQFLNALPHGMLGIVMALCIISVLAGEKGRKLITVLFIGMVVTAMIGKGGSIKGGRELRSVTDIRGIMKEGPAIGILSDYMCCYIYNSDYEDFAANIEEGENVLIVTNMVKAPGTTPYMFGDYKVCHFSIVDPTSYDERLLTYWELYPEKKPDVIVVDCWYGQLMEDPDNWIMKYIENDFGYSECIDGKYVRFYKR
ncbi:MAG: glycosyltransferase family 39 protein [Lachnospiraceae bacterium]|nr:glycosyltransferase family 39 protein [Lachnospiraceae bacterium]